MKVFRCRLCGEVYIGEEKPKSCPFCGAYEAMFDMAKEMHKEGSSTKAFRCRLCGEVCTGEEKPKSCPLCGADEALLDPAKERELLRGDSLSDVTKKHLRKALDLEIDNTNFYKAVSEKSRDAYVSSMFKGLSKVEGEHASTICKHLNIAKPDSDVGKDKAVDSDSDNIEEANRREKMAVTFYTEAMEAVPEKEMKEFFRALTEIESDHLLLTKKEG